MFDIIMGSQVVGSARLEREGLYYRIFCSCTPPDSGIYRIVVTDGNNTKDLGICVPSGTVARVPIKCLSGDKLTFTLVPKDRTDTVVAVATDEPFALLDKLDTARLQVTDDRSEIVIDPVQDPQDSDPNQEPENKWEQP